MEFLQELLGNSELAILSAFLLGLMTAISPCPLATNITAIGFLSKDIDNRKKVFYQGLIYTLGRAITYFTIGLLFFIGADQFKISGLIQQWGEKLLGPILIIIGIFMLDFFTIKFPGFSRLSNKMEEKSKSGYLGVLLLGVVFALAFCPYSGVLYFGMLIPLTMSSTGGLFLPVVFALATGIPVIIFAWFLAFSVGSVGKLYNSIKIFEYWFRRIIAILFIGVGIYYIILFYI
jgi:cytochrome c biogenesis protein CcdA